MGRETENKLCAWCIGLNFLFKKAFVLLSFNCQSFLHRFSKTCAPVTVIPKTISNRNRWNFTTMIELQQKRI